MHDADAFDQLPPTTPVLIGVGEVSETLGSPDYAARSEAALAADAVRVLDAQEALAAGLVSRVVPRGSALAVARELCARIEEAAPTAVRASLRVSREVAVPGRTSRSVDEVAFSEDLLDRLS